MGGITSVPQPTFGPTGVTIPSTDAILAGVQADMNAAFGGGLSPALATPQGQLATTQTAIISDAYAQFLWFCNQVDPAYAQGRMQDALGRIYFMTRIPAAPTTVTATCIGDNVTIPVGALARAADGNIYSATEGGSIPLGGGSIDLTFACLTPGPIACPADSLNQIYQALGGWDAISNAADGVEGTNVESRAAFEQRRKDSLQKNAQNVNGAILGQVLDVPGVLDAYVVDNPANTPATIGGVTIGANTLFVSVAGGAALAVAQAVFTKKPPGIPMQGNTSETVTDPNPLYSSPPSYTITFENPTPLEILIAVTIKNGPNVPADAATQVQNAVLAAFTGADGGTRARIGSLLFASRYFAGVAALGAWAQIVGISIGTGATPAAGGAASITGTLMNVTGSPTGTFGPGQLVQGPNIAPGTMIVSNGTGTGGAGTYNVNVTQSAAVGAVSAYSVGLATQQVNIDQVPVTSAPNIALVLV